MNTPGHSQRIDNAKDASDAYFLFLNGLPADKKLRLAVRLIESVRVPRKAPDRGSEKEEFIPEKTAEELIADLRNARAFAREREDF